MKKINLNFIPLAFIFLMLLSCSKKANTTTEDFYKIGIDLYNNEKYSEAILNFTKALEINPKDTNAIYMRAWTNQAAGNKKEAINDYTQTLALNPNFAEAYYLRGIMNTEINYKRAIADYDSAIKYNSNYGEAYNNRGIVKIKLGLVDAGCTDLNKAILLNIKEAIESKKYYCE